MPKDGALYMSSCESPKDLLSLYFFPPQHSTFLYEKTAYTLKISDRFFCGVTQRHIPKKNARYHVACALRYPNFFVSIIVIITIITFITSHGKNHPPRVLGSYSRERERSDKSRKTTFSCLFFFFYFLL